MNRLARELYDVAAAGLPGLGSPGEMAEAHRRSAGSREAAADSLARAYSVLAGATGFAFGLPGYAAMPVTIPGNVAGLLLLQLHLAAAFASLGGRDPRDPAVRDLCVACVLDGRPGDPRRADAGGLWTRMIGKVGERGLRWAAERALARMASASRRLPVLGGGIGGYMDGRSTARVARRARRRLLAPAGAAHAGALPDGDGAERATVDESGTRTTDDTGG